jgi:hypothetical protein
MSDELKSDEEIEKPTSGTHLAKLLECEPDEGVVLAVFQEELEEVTTKEVPFTDSNGGYMHVVLVHTKHWGERALDVIASNEEKVKWWRAKAIIHDQKLDTVPIRWEGPIGEIPQMYFDKDYILALRFYDAGPWFFPHEQPTIAVPEHLKNAVDALANAAASSDQPAGQ